MYREQIVLANAQSAGTAFNTCLRLFRHYPMAVRRHYAEHRYGSMVLVTRDGGVARFFVLIMEWDDLFVVRPWDRRAWARVEIRPDGQVPDDVRRLLAGAVPVPRDGALLGWVTDYQVRALVVARGRLPEPWEDASAVPEVTVLPLAGTQPAIWPPLAADPLADWRLWEYIGRGRLADLAPLLGRRPGRAFWVPGTDGGPRRRASGRIVVTERLSAAECWLPAGIYADQRTLREPGAVPSASQLLARPGAVDLARGLHLLGA
jgi:hypothetical protein